MPIIENINDSEKEMKDRRIFLQDIRGIERMDMKPVSNYGSTKYKALGKIIPQFNNKTISICLWIERKANEWQSF
ncbi:hypothetical protein [Anaerocolumna sp. MB42-C2]|uniref:hypothetical protein n=1 Tax=Anaerocolumna sp. MB42-C2 TaxID=3070997 RepID=UPI0027E1D2BB|nr:hypothetical protein [Anaerocolumna sp. MB42-C2]WMJ86839.1 hypothetical protein RBU59_22815 [Anaerocolumna sp. MB42-C2]